MRPLPYPTTESSSSSHRLLIAQTFICPHRRGTFSLTSHKHLPYSIADAHKRPKLPRHLVQISHDPSLPNLPGTSLSTLTRHPVVRDFHIYARPPSTSSSESPRLIFVNFDPLSPHPLRPGASSSQFIYIGYRDWKFLQLLSSNIDTIFHDLCWRIKPIPFLVSNHHPSWHPNHHRDRTY